MLENQINGFIAYCKVTGLKNKPVQLFHQSLQYLGHRFDPVLPSSPIRCRLQTAFHPCQKGQNLGLTPVFELKAPGQPSWAYEFRPKGEITRVEPSPGGVTFLGPSGGYIVRSVEPRHLAKARFIPFAALPVKLQKKAKEELQPGETGTRFYRRLQLEIFGEGSERRGFRILEKNPSGLLMDRASIEKYLA